MWNINFRVRVLYTFIYICTKESLKSFFFYILYFFLFHFSFCTLLFLDFSFLLILFLFAYFLFFFKSNKLYKNDISKCYSRMLLYINIFYNSGYNFLDFYKPVFFFFFFYVYSMRWGIVIPIFQRRNWDWERMLVKDHPQSFQLQWFLNPGQSPACDSVDHTDCCSCHLCFF